MGSGERDVVAKAVWDASECSGVVFVVLGVQCVIAHIEAGGGGEGCVEKCTWGVK